MVRPAPSTRIKVNPLLTQFGATRSARLADHLLQTPDTFVRAPMPGMEKATAIIHIAPSAGARFLQYTVEFESGGELGRCVNQRFFYVLDGEVAVAKLGTFGRGGYAYLPAGDKRSVTATSEARVAVIEKKHEPLAGAPRPLCFCGAEANIAGLALLDADGAVEVRPLVPAGPAYDFAVNVMTFQPGAVLPMVEIHVMEHGLLMLEGGGVYRLNNRWYPVAAGDFIWMAPYCPQWFGALGKEPAKYLIYKDWNRSPRA